MLLQWDELTLFNVRFREARAINGMIETYPALAQLAAKEDWSHTDFLEAILKAESEAHKPRTRSTLTRMAGVPGD